MIAIGAHVGPYTLTESLSVGRRTALYRATVRDDASGLPPRALARVALASDDLEAAAAVASEHDALTQLDDARIPSVLLHLPAESALLLRDPGGVTLRDVQRAGAAGAVRLDLGTVLDLLVELAGALRHAHARGVVHGAISPERVVLGDDAEVVLLGFGAPARPPAEAPEQADGVTDPRTDQWLLAAFALALLRHDPEASGEDPPASAGALLARLAARAPVASEVLTRMLSPDPAERFDEESLVRALLRAAREFGGVSRRGEVAVATRAWRGSRAPAAVPPDGAAEASALLDAGPTPGHAPAVTLAAATAPEVVASLEPPLARRLKLDGALASARSGQDAPSEPSVAGVSVGPELGGAAYRGAEPALVDASPDLPDTAPEPMPAPRLFRGGLPLGGSPGLSADRGSDGSRASVLVEEEPSAPGIGVHPLATHSPVGPGVDASDDVESPDHVSHVSMRAARVPQANMRSVPDWIPVVALVLLAASSLYALARALG
jgi:hypothetical protein